MIKKSILIFLIISGLLLGSALLFIQSESFATFVKEILKKHIPEELGIDLEFTAFQLHYFPPGISIEEPRLGFKEKNQFGLSENSKVSAEYIDLLFYPLQMLARTVQISEVRIRKGKIFVDFEETKKAPRNAPKNNLEWAQLFNFRVDSIVIENSEVEAHWDKHKQNASGTVKELQVDSLQNDESQSIETNFSLMKLKTSLFPIQSFFEGEEEFSGNLVLHSSNVEVRSARYGKTENFLSFEGNLAGNPLNPQELVADLAFRLKGQGSWFQKIFSIENEIGGVWHAKGSIKGQIQKMKEQGTIEINADGENLKFGVMEVREAKIEAKLAKGELLISNLEAESPPEEKQGGFHPGSGGKIRIVNGKISAGFREGVLPVEITNAHSHWLLKPVIKNIYELDFRVTGKAKVELKPVGEKDIAIFAETELSLPKFTLDNQGYQKSKTSSKIIEAPNLKVKGGVRIDSHGVSFKKVLLSLPESEVEVTGSVERNIYDIKAEGKVNLSNLTTLGNSAIHGSGALRAHIHGPMSAIRMDFYPDLVNSEYLRMRLGEVKGKISWDDVKNRLLLEGATSTVGKTKIDLNGSVDLGKVEKIDITGVVQEGDLRDISKLSGLFHEDIPWFPSSMSGAVRGTIQVSGTPSLSGLKVETDLEGPYWMLYAERFKRGKLKAAYDRGAYVVEYFEGVKGDGRLMGSINVAANGEMEWELKSAGLSLKDFDSIRRLAIPLKGRVTFDSSGAGKKNSTRSYTEVAFRDVWVRGVPYEDSKATLETNEDRAILKANGVGEQASVDLVYPFKVGQESSLNLQFKDFDFSPLLLLLNPHLVRETELIGRISSTLKLSFKGGSVEKGNGSFALTDYQVKKSGLKISLLSPIHSEIKEGSFSINPLILKSNQEEAKLILRSQRGELEGVIEGTTDFGILSLITSAIDSAEGAIKLEGRIRGNIKEPKVFGRALFEGSTIRVRALSSPVENLAGTIRVQQNVIYADDIVGDLATGRVFLNGSAKLFESVYPDLNLNLTLANTRLKFFPFQYLKANGTLKITGSDLPYLMEGVMRSDAGLIREKVMGGSVGAQKKTNRFPPPPSPWASDRPLFKLSIHGISDAGIFVKNDLFDAELKGDIFLIHTFDAPRMTGEVSVKQGKMIFKNRIFDIQTAQAFFENPVVIDPRFVLVANTEVEKNNIRFFAQGKLNDYRVELSSTPALPEPEILSLLTLGYTLGDVQRRRSADIGYGQQGEAASVLLHSFDFNRDVQEKTGLEIEVDESADTRSASSIFRPQETVVGGGSSPKIVIKRQLGRRFNLSFGSTVGVGNGSEKEVSMEAKVTPAFSVIGIWNSFEATSAGTGTTADEKQESYGVDFKVQKRFK